MESYNFSFYNSFVLSANPKLKKNSPMVFEFLSETLTTNRNITLFKQSIKVKNNSDNMGQ